MQELIDDLLSPQPSTVLASATFIRKLLAKGECYWLCVYVHACVCMCVCVCVCDHVIM